MTLHLSGNDAALFCSDMHLDASEPNKAADFLAQLLLASQDVSHVFMLGDIFEAWVGDDQADSVALQTQGTLATLSARGLHVAIIRGNRDFLLGESLPDNVARFDWRSIASLLVDPYRIDCFGQPVLLSHGDAWCSHDHSYQEFRARRNQAQWRHDFLARPLHDRLDLARQMRAQSRLETANKSLYLMDVTQAVVEQAMQTAKVQCVVHGHTHRPARHVWRNGDQELTRWVLPDWTSEPQRGGFLRVRDDGWQQMGRW